MKLCVISHAYVESANLPIISALAAQPGVELALITPARYMVDLQHASGVFLTSSGTYRTYAIPIRFGSRQGAFLYHSGPLKAALDDFAPDILLHEQEVFALGAGQIAWIAARRRLPLIMQVAENIRRDLALPRRWLRDYVLGRCTGLMCWSEGSASVHKSWGFAGQVAVIPCMGVATLNPQPAFGRRNGDVFEICFAGRLVHIKGVDCMLRAVATLRSRGVALRCRVVGHGPEQDNLKALTRTLGLDSHVEFFGVLPQPDVLKLLSNSDVLVLPSRTSETFQEQFGRVLVQAMGEGTVTIGSRTGAIPDVIDDDALLFAENDFTALADLIERLARNTPELKRQQRRLWQRAQSHYLNDTLAAQKAAFLRDILEVSRPTS